MCIYLYCTNRLSQHISITLVTNLRGMLSDLPNEGGDVLLDVLVPILETRQYRREYLSLHHHLGEVHRVLSYLRQR